MQLNEAIRRLFGRFGQTEQTPRPVRGRVDHVIIIDGTLSSLRDGCETNAGLAYKLLSSVTNSHMSVRYEAGVQWQAWRTTLDVIEGRGINRQIRRVYGFLASRYRPGDRIFLFGYSRGAYAVRSLAGIIDRVGLVRSEHATERNVQIAYRHYQRGADSTSRRAFVRRFCHDEAPVEMVGVWDTVKALGFRAPILWRWAETRHAFHNHHLGPTIRHGYHALALDETREAYAPVLWTCPEGWDGHVEQMWFRGTHGDVGGQLSVFEAARPLANIPLVWILGKAEMCGLALPEGWRTQFPCDPDAPSVGTTRGWGKLFVLRKRRVVGADPTERLHPTAEKPVPAARPGWLSGMVWRRPAG